MKPFAIVVAMDEAGGIGKCGQLPWHLPEDLKHFKQLTCQTPAEGAVNAVIMGRKTWESLPEKFRPLPGRLNVVITSQKDLGLPSGVARCSSLERALEYTAAQSRTGRVFVIGGGQIFRQALEHPACREVHATFLRGAFGCDVFLPPLPPRFQPVQTGPWQSRDRLSYRFIDFRSS